jgi:uncharacterized membrane protein YkvA (DUF1232 family)
MHHLELKRRHHLGTFMANSFWGQLKAWARRLEADTLAVWLAARDPRTPWYARVLAVVIAAYALSPIDLIPDFIPIIGMIDDLVIVPAGLWLVTRLVPRDLMEELRARAASQLAERPTSIIAAIVIVAIWIGLLALLIVSVAY